MDLGHCTYGASNVSMGSSPNMANKVHVLLVEHESYEHDILINMLRSFSYEVTSVNLASTGLSVISKEKAQYDIVIANMDSPDSYTFQLLQDAVKMDLLVILMMNVDDAPTTMRALDQGAFLCVKKPVTMQMLGYLWQHVSREKLYRVKEDDTSTNVANNNSQAPAKELGEQDPVNGNRDNAENQKWKKKVNLGNDSALFKRKVWTEWTEELHWKFMDAAKQLGPGRCYPKDILDLMNVPGLTRMQVASHLQKCRNAKWLPPEKRKSKQGKTEATTLRDGNKPRRSKTLKFGSMPFLDEVSSDPPMEISNNGYNPPHLLHQEANGTFYTGQYGLTSDEPVFATPLPNISSNFIGEDELAIMESLMAPNLSGFLQGGGGMDYIPGSGDQGV